jgi:hypothetical protein
MNDRVCCFIDYTEGEGCCGRIARLKHGDAWLCASHYDLVMDYVSGRGTGGIVFGYDLGLNQDPVFVVLYK